MEKELVQALSDIALQLRNLGNGDAATQMGAIENLAKEIKEASERIADSNLDIANSIREVAESISLKEK